VKVQVIVLYSGDANNDQGYPVSAGVYFFNIVAGNFSKTKKMLLLK